MKAGTTILAIILTACGGPATSTPVENPEHGGEGESTEPIAPHGLTPEQTEECCECQEDCYDDERECQDEKYEDEYMCQEECSESGDLSEVDECEAACSEKHSILACDDAYNDCLDECGDDCTSAECNIEIDDGY